MTPEEAVERTILLAASGWEGDCADVCAAYLGELRGAPVERPAASRLSPSAVTSVLGKPRREAPRFGDVVLSGQGLGVWLGYAVLTSDESSRRMVRIPPPRGSVLAWSVGRG